MARGRVRHPLPDTSPPSSGLPRAVTSRQAVKAVDMARKRQPAPKYAGALAQPIYADDFYKFAGGLGRLYQETDRAMIRKRASEKMLLLFKHYRIDPSGEQKWQELATSLAFAHVPGLQLAFRPKPGRKPTWKTGLGDKFEREVEDVKSRTGKSTEDAIAMLQEVSGGMWEKYSVENLGARYREARARQKALASLCEAWRNELNALAAAPSATPPAAGRLNENTGRPTKISARAKTSRRK
jgi:hypothetical protein